MERCLYCYKELKEGQVDYHPACARKLFGTRQAPQLPSCGSEIGELAKQVVRADYADGRAGQIVARCESRRKERAGPFYHRGLVGESSF